MKTIKTFPGIFFLGLALVAAHVNAASSVWKISSGENYFYLGGSIHVLSMADYPLPKEFTTAFENADALVFETDIAAAGSPEFQQLLLGTVTYGDNRSLASELEEDTFQRLDTFLKSRYLSIDTFSKMKPWGLSLVVTVMEYQRLGMEAAYGVDAFFNRAAIAEGKATLYLETPEEQLAFIKTMEKIDPNDTINYMLRDVKEFPEFSRFMIATWRSGKLEKFTTHPYTNAWQSDFPEFWGEIITRRNNNWMTQLPSLLEDERTEFVLVGALHLAGEEGLLNQLRQQGFKIEQL